MTVPLAVGHKADAHQLVTVELLLAAQATDGFLIRIFSGNTTGNVDGWFHTVLNERDREGTIPVRAREKVYHAVGLGGGKTYADRYIRVPNWL